jgi:hypothetical protein
LRTRQLNYLVALTFRQIIEKTAPCKSGSSDMEKGRHGFTGNPSCNEQSSTSTSDGPRACGEFIAELVDAMGADPKVLDRLLEWSGIDPAIVRAVGGDRWPRAIGVVHDAVA